MDKSELVNLTTDQLADAILAMGHIIRHLDEGCEYLEYWTQDGEYIAFLPGEKAGKIQ